MEVKYSIQYGQDRGWILKEIFDPEKGWTEEEVFHVWKDGSDVPVEWNNPVTAREAEYNGEQVKVQKGSDYETFLNDVADWDTPYRPAIQQSIATDLSSFVGFRVTRTKK